jgi:AcrR family transcriptional regulator
LPLEQPTFGEIYREGTFLFDGDTPVGEVVEKERSLYYALMPRVSQQYRDARRREILEAAARCFAENGFHSTSMQDFFTSSGFTAGLVYRYFSTKDDLIASVAGEALEQLLASVEEAIRAEPRPSVEDVIGRMIATVDALDQRERITRIALQVWAEALRNPSVKPIVTGGIGRLRDLLESLARDAQADGRVDPGIDPAFAAGALLSLVPGFIIQRALDPALDRAAYEQAVRALVRGQLHFQIPEIPGTGERAKIAAAAPPRRRGAPPDNGGAGATGTTGRGTNDTGATGTAGV